MEAILFFTMKETHHPHLTAISETYNEFLAELYQSADGQRVEIWQRGFYRTGAVFAYQVGEKDMPIHCFVIFNDGTIQHGHHHDLGPMMLGAGSDQSIGIGNKKKFFDKY